MWQKIISVFWLLFWLFCFLVPVRAIEITESELIELETLTLKQQEALEQSREALKQSETLRKQSETKYVAALQKLKAVDNLATAQESQIQTLKVQSARLSTQISESAASYAKLEIERTQTETKLLAKISIRNKIIAVLGVIVSAFIVFKIVKFLMLKKL